MSNEEYGDYVSIAGRPGRGEMGAVSVLGCPAPMGGFQGRHDLVTCSSDVVCPPASLPPGWLARANLADVSLWRSRSKLAVRFALRSPSAASASTAGPFPVYRPDALPLCGRRLSSRSRRTGSKVVRLAGLAL